MPLKKDASGRRLVEMVLDVPGTPEEVWRAIATGPGFTAWFVPTTIEEHVGGDIAFTFGPDMVSRGSVTIWRPPFEVGFEERDWSGEAPPLATEITIEAKAGGTCTIRMVHALFTAKDDWDGELENMENGWVGFFHVLKIYLGEFPDAHAASGRVWATPPSEEDGWTKLLGFLGLTEFSPGSRIGTAEAGGPRVTGVAERMIQGPKHREIMARLETPMPGIALIGVFEAAGKTYAAANLYFYGDGADAVLAEVEAGWQGWADAQFGPGDS